jgi:DNA repair protein RadC
MSQALRIHDLPEEERPRERLASLGADALSNAELIAILLRTGLKGRSAIDVAQDLLQRFPSLDALAKASLDQLRVKGVGRDKAVTLKAAFTLARRMAREVHREAPLLDTPESIAELMREELRMSEVEEFHAVLLNVRKRLIRTERISLGTLDTILVHPREVFRQAILANASSVVLVHNHPSGDPHPSDADVRVTRDLIRAGQLLRIELVDHVVVGQRSDRCPRGFASLKELGLFH